MKWRKNILIGVIWLFALSIPTSPANAGIYQIIKAAVVKAIKAADLAIQRQQNRVIWLQNAQKVLENALSKLRLDEISEWTQKQKDQYQEYFESLRKVKMLISYYQRIKDISAKKLMLVEEYRRVWTLILNDKHFTSEEVEYMGKVYNGILNETVKNVDQLSIVINSFKTQMSDAKRLEIINQVAEKIDENYTALRLFNGENAVLSIQRAKSEAEMMMIKRLYGIDQ